MKKLAILITLVLFANIMNAEIFIPMDDTQTDHLKAYGVAFNALQKNIIVKWLLNYRGGSYLLENSTHIENLCKIRGVSYEIIDGSRVSSIMNEISQNNMDSIVLEKEPKIAVYSPPNKQPWDDAVTMVLTYAEIEYDTLWDAEVLAGDLNEFDWLHLHHEDFTGQYGKFYRSFRNAKWYIDEVEKNETLAANLGYDKVWKMKHAVAETIRRYVESGGFLFAMCAATDTYDIALATQDVDICNEVFDGDGIDPNYRNKLDFSRTFAFTDFSLVTSPLVYEFSSIDASDYAKLRSAEEEYFQLFDFSAKYDPVPTMLTQCHTNIVNGFLGQTTSFHKKYVKKSVIILGESPHVDEVKYLHGNYGKGTFTYYGGHDPEDYQHKIGDPETVLDYKKNSAGYRLILNNILFPAAEKKKLKT